MVTIQPIVLDQLSIYFDGYRWELFPGVPVTRSHIFYRQDNESYEQFIHRVYAICDTMNDELAHLSHEIISLQNRLVKLEKAFSHCTKGVKES